MRLFQDELRTVRHSEPTNSSEPNGGISASVTFWSFVPECEVKNQGQGQTLSGERSRFPPNVCLIIRGCAPTVPFPQPPLTGPAGSQPQRRARARTHARTHARTRQAPCQLLQSLPPPAAFLGARGGFLPERSFGLGAASPFSVPWNPRSLTKWWRLLFLATRVFRPPGLWPPALLKVPILWMCLAYWLLQRDKSEQEGANPGTTFVLSGGALQLAETLPPVSWTQCILFLPEEERGHRGQGAPQTSRGPEARRGHWQQDRIYFPAPSSQKPSPHLLPLHPPHPGLSPTPSPSVPCSCRLSLPPASQAPGSRLPIRSLPPFCVASPGQPSSVCACACVGLHMCAREQVPAQAVAPACLSSSRRSRPSKPRPVGAHPGPVPSAPAGLGVLVSSCISLFSSLSLCPSSDLDRDFWNNNESTVQQKWSSYPPKEFILNISPYAPYGDPRLSLK
ncbi:Hypothetical predicted protein [Marmota monax]|uniref:Uncharacterized protein n=1 Tax=Marmota monax TaxID=9995 RepID=A0A5E4AJ59_MARMO|nr:Hypothetical predicted protein [Marmota monax]